MGKTAESTLSVIIFNACTCTNETFICKLCVKSCLKVLTVYEINR
jgi:hypothetical protein